MPNDDFRQWPTAEIKGIDNGYKKDQPRALGEFYSQMAGPKHPGVPEASIKNPAGELQNPALFRQSDDCGPMEPEIALEMGKTILKANKVEPAAAKLQSRPNQ